MMEFTIFLFRMKDSGPNKKKRRNAAMFKEIIHNTEIKKMGETGFLHEVM